MTDMTSLAPRSLLRSNAIPQFRKPPATGGKRGPSAPIVNSSDEEAECDVKQTPVAVKSTSESLTSESSADGSASALSSTDYENVASPCSSTASGPIYVRKPGFDYHGHAFVARPRIKKKKTTLSLRDGLRKRDPTPPKCKPKKDPLPMRMRAFPQSFWQQPNVPPCAAPGTMYPILPPLHKDSSDEVSDIRPITPPNDNVSRDNDRPEKNTSDCDLKPKVKPGLAVPHPPESRLTVANPDLLLRLFDAVKEKSPKSSTHLRHRGRPRKIMSSTNTTMVRGDDPFIMEAMSAKLFPQLSLDGNGKQIGGPGHHSLQLITIKEGDKSVTLPSLSFEQNYSQMLSELVAHI